MPIVSQANLTHTSSQVAIGKKQPLFKRFFPGISDLLVIWALYGIAYPHLSTFANDPGLGWHLQSGRIMMESGSVLREDPFLAGNARAWVPDQWLGSIFISWIFSLGGWSTLYAVFLVCSLVTFMIFVRILAARNSGSYLAAAVAAIFAMKLASVQMMIRPVVLSIAFFAAASLAVFSLVRTYRVGAQLTLRMWFWLPLLFLVWANVHPYFILGLVLILAATISLLLESIVASSKVDKRITTFCIVLACCFLATLVNPFGIYLYQKIVGLGLSPFYTDFLLEWKSIDFKSGEGQLLQGMIAVIVLGYVLTLECKNLWGFFELIIIAAFLRFSVESVRGLPLFAILAAPLFAQSLVSFSQISWFGRFGIMRRFFRVCRKAEDFEQNTSKGLLGVMAASVVLIVVSYRSGTVPYYQGEYGPSKSTFPYHALEVLAAAGTVARVANEFNWGGFITWKGYPMVKPLVDDRLTLHKEVFYREYLDKLKLGGQWREYLSEHQATHLLLKRNNPLALFLEESGDLPQVHADDTSVIFALK